MGGTFLPYKCAFVQKLAVGLLTRGQDKAMAQTVGGEEPGGKNCPNRPWKVAIVKVGTVVID